MFIKKLIPGRRSSSSEKTTPATTDKKPPTAGTKPTPTPSAINLKKTDPTPVRAPLAPLPAVLNCSGLKGPRIALCGGSGSGKTTVAAILNRMYPSGLVVSADDVAHKVLFPDHPYSVKSDLLGVFGEGILDAKGEVSREKVRRIVIDDPEAMGRLNAVMLPAIQRSIIDVVKAQKKVMPLIFDGEGIDFQFARPTEMWIVTAKDDVRARRLAKRQAISEESAAQIFRHEPTTEERLRAFSLHGYIVREITNDDDTSLEDLEAKCTEMMRTMSWHNDVNGADISSRYRRYYEDLHEKSPETTQSQLHEMERMTKSLVKISRLGLVLDSTENHTTTTTIPVSSFASPFPFDDLMLIITSYLPFKDWRGLARLNKQQFLRFMLGDELWKYRAVAWQGCVPLAVTPGVWLPVVNHIVEDMVKGYNMWNSLDFVHVAKDKKIFSSKFAMIWNHERQFLWNQLITSNRALTPSASDVPFPRLPYDNPHIRSAYCAPEEDTSSSSPSMLKYAVALITKHFSPDVGGLIKDLIVPRLPSPLVRLDFSRVEVDVVVAEDGQYCAAAMYRIIPHFRGGCDPNLLEVLFVAVDPGERWKGVGVTVQKHLEHVARKRHSCCAMYVETGPVSTNAFWEGYGFRRVQTLSGMIDAFDLAYFDSRCLRFRDTEQHVKLLT